MASHHIRGTNAIRQQRTFRPLPPLLHSTHHGRWPPKRADGALDGPPDDRENAYAAVAPDQIFDASYFPSQLLPLEALRRPVEFTQYTSLAFGRRCEVLGVRPSMGSVGDAYDNAMAESFFATLECELIERRRFHTRAEATMAVFGYIEGWYNPRRRHSSLGYESPASFERKHGPEGRFSPASALNARTSRKPTRHDAPGSTIAAPSDLGVPPVLDPATIIASTTANSAPGPASHSTPLRLRRSGSP